MAQVFSKRVKYAFNTISDLETAQQKLDAHYPHLRTSNCESLSRGEFILFVESTLSFIYDSVVESLMKDCGGKKLSS